MRILKLKIARAQEWRKARELQLLNSIKVEPLPSSPLPSQSSRQLRLEAREKIRHSYEASSPSEYSGGSKRSKGNNVMKNYARAMVNFSLSALADPYLERMKGKYAMNAEKFKVTLLGYKKKVNCIKHLRGILLINKHDTEEMKTFKGIFQELCIVFMKYFSVNWIFHGKMNEKSKYLHYRGKMLRRVQNPEYFTYLESFVEKKASKKDIYGRRVD